MSKLIKSPAIKTTLILAIVYALGWLATNLYLDRTAASCQIGACNQSAGVAATAFLVIWKFGFAAVAIIIILAVIIMEAIEDRRKNNQIPQK